MCFTPFEDILVIIVYFIHNCTCEHCKFQLPVFIGYRVYKVSKISYINFQKTEFEV